MKLKFNIGAAANFTKPAVAELTADRRAASAEMCRFAGDKKGQTPPDKNPPNSPVSAAGSALRRQRSAPSPVCCSRPPRWHLNFRQDRVDIRPLLVCASKIKVKPEVPLRSTYCRHKSDDRISNFKQILKCYIRINQASVLLFFLPHKCPFSSKFLIQPCVSHVF